MMENTRTSLSSLQRMTAEDADDLRRLSGSSPFAASVFCSRLAVVEVVEVLRSLWVVVVLTLFI